MTRPTKNFYAYRGAHRLGEEPLGTEGKMIARDLKTVGGMVRRCRAAWGSGPFRVYTFTNFYDDRTFRLVASR